MNATTPSYVSLTPYQSCNSSFIQAKDNPGPFIITPSTNLTDHLPSLRMRKRFSILQAIHAVTLHNYFGMFGAMWLYRGRMLAQYAYHVWESVKNWNKNFVYKQFPTYLGKKLEKGTYKEPYWWGDEQIHSSHAEYLSTDDPFVLKFPIQAYNSKKKYPPYL